MVLAPLWVLTACQPVPVPSLSCEEAVEAAPNIERVEGLEMIVTAVLASTLASCGTSAEWTKALIGHPESVGAEVISVDEANDYLAASCQLYWKEDAYPMPCIDAE